MSMKTSEHIAFARYIASQIYFEEMNRRGISRTPFADTCAQVAIDWIGRNIGTLPDYLEPGFNTNHRKIFHSKDVFRLLEKWKANIRAQPTINFQWDIFRLMACSAYQSHIWLDSGTPMGVPDYQWVWKLLEAFEKR